MDVVEVMGVVEVMIVVQVVPCVLVKPTVTMGLRDFAVEASFFTATSFDDFITFLAATAVDAIKNMQKYSMSHMT